MSHEAIQYLPLERITVLPQVRQQIDEESLRGLAVTLKRIGQQSPIRIRRDGDRLIVVDGERRLMAAKLAGFSTIAVIIEERPLNAGEVTQRQLIANCQRKNLSPLEIAGAIAELIRETNWQYDEVAAELGFSPATVSRLLALLELPAPIQSQVAAGKIPASSAYQIARASDPQQQADLAEQVASGQLTRDALNGQMKRHKQSEKEAPKGVVSPSRVTAALDGSRSVTVKGPGLTLESFIGWLEELLAKARKARPRGVELQAFIKMLKEQAQA